MLQVPFLALLQLLTCFFLAFLLDAAQQYDQIATTLFKIMVRMKLCSKRVLKEYRFNELAFRWVIDNIIMRRVIAKQSSEEWSQDDREPLLEGGCCCPSGRSS